MSPKDRVGASNLRRRQILDSALDLFLQTGVGGCRVEDLLERSAASAGSFYHHFGGKAAVATELHFEILDDFHSDFLAELLRHRSARSGIRAMVGHHLRWAAEQPDRAAFLFQCLEPEVAVACRDRENQMTTAFLGQCFAWLNRRVAEGHIRKLSPLLYWALWMGPTLELTRTWLMNVQMKWTWMTAEQLRPESLLRAERNLSEAAWEMLRAK